jgi:hypothetical protein
VQALASLPITPRFSDFRIFFSFSGIDGLGKKKDMIPVLSAQHSTACEF